MTDPTTRPEEGPADAPDAPDTPIITPSETPATEADGGATSALKAERQARRDAERRAREAEERATSLIQDAARRTVASELGLSPEAAALIVGDDEDTMREHAEQLVAAFRPAAGDIRRLPTEQLKPGATSSADTETPSTVADRVLRGSW